MLQEPLSVSLSSMVADLCAPEHITARCPTRGCQSETALSIRRWKTPPELLLLHLKRLVAFCFSVLMSFHWQCCVWFAVQCWFTCLSAVAGLLGAPGRSQHQWMWKKWLKSLMIHRKWWVKCTAVVHCAPLSTISCTLIWFDLNMKSRIWHFAENFFKITFISTTVTIQNLENLRLHEVIARFSNIKKPMLIIKHCLQQQENSQQPISTQRHQVWWCIMFCFWHAESVWTTGDVSARRTAGNRWPLHCCIATDGGLAHMRWC